MKNWVLSNLSLKFISVLFALGLWMAVVNLSDPVTTKNFKNIPVSFLNESVLTDEGKVFEVLEGSNNVTITVKAKRSIVESLDANDFKATADFSERISENAVPINVTAKKYDDKIQEILLQNNTVKISIEDKIDKEIPVDLQVIGNAGEGYTVGSVSVSPDKVTVSGPRSLVEKVESMQVLLDASNVTSDISMKTQGALIDKSDNEIKDDRLHCNTSEFQVEAKLLHTKSVDLDFAVEGTVADGYRYVDLEYTPTTILIAGEMEALENISTIQIPSAELNMDGATGPLRKEVNVSRYLPENIELVNKEEETVAVTLNILSLSTQTISYPVSKIDVLNTPSGMDMEFVNNGSIELELQGLSNDFADFSFADSVSISVDLKGLTEGEHRLRTVAKTVNNLKVVEEPYVTIILKSRESNSHLDEPGIATPIPDSTTHNNMTGGAINQTENQIQNNSPSE